MAEITQEELEEAKPIKRQVSTEAVTRKKYDDPIDVTGPDITSFKMYREMQKGIGAGGWIAMRINEGREKLIGQKIKEEMDEDHLKMMVDISENLGDTEIENLDFLPILDGYQNRHNTDFRLGRSNADGKPAKKIRDIALDEYDLPGTQKEMLTKHYNILKSKGLEYLMQQVPKLQGQKAMFYLSKIASDATDKAAFIFGDEESFEGGIGRIWFEHEGPITEDYIFIPHHEFGVLGELTEEGKQKISAVTQRTPFTNDLTNSAVSKIATIVQSYDIEVFKSIEAGHIELEDGISMQREMTQNILNSWFLSDIARNPEGAFLKIKHNRYAMKRQFGLKEKKGAKAKLATEMIYLGEQHWKPFMSQMLIKKREELQAAEQKIKDDDTQIAVGNLTQIYEDPELMERATKETHKELERHYLQIKGVDRPMAQKLAYAFEMKRRIMETGRNAKMANIISTMITKDFVNDEDKAIAKYAYSDKDGILTANSTSEIQKVIKVDAETFWANYPLLGATIGKAEDGAKLINRADIQGFLNTISANRKTNEKNLFTNIVTSQSDTIDGREYIKTEYFGFNSDGNGRFILDMDKIKETDAWKSGDFTNEAEIANTLIPALRSINKERESARIALKKKTDNLPAIQSRLRSRGESQLNLFATHKTKEFLEKLATIPKEESPIGQNIFYEQYQEEIARALDIDITSLSREERSQLVPGGLNHRWNLVDDLFNKLDKFWEALQPAANTQLAYIDKIIESADKYQYHAYAGTVAKAIFEVAKQRRIDLQENHFLTTVTRQCSTAGDQFDQTACIIKQHSIYGYELNDPKLTLGGDADSPEIKNTLEIWGVEGQLEPVNKD